MLGAFAQAQTVVLDESFTSGLGQFTAASSSSVTTGTFGARMNGTYGGTDGQITSGPLNTQGLTNLTLSFTRTTVGLDSGEVGVASYSVNGTTYTTIESLQSASGAISFTLGTAAENQTQLRLRFRISASTSSETYSVDSIRLVGTGGGGGCEPNCPPPPTNPFEKGPVPTTSALEATTGPFTTASVTVSASATPGFGAGTIYYPNTTPGSFAAIAVVPGFSATQSSVNWWGPRLASHGFVVIVFDTNSTSDNPDSRATQLMAALNYLVTLGNTSGHAVFQKVDGNRRGVMGWSMGGGGTLIAARDNPTLKGAIPFAPWNSSTTNFSGVTVPTLIIACESDSTAPVSSHASPFYESIPTSVDKAYLEINNGSHSCAGSGSSNKPMLGKYGVAWMKRFMDNDTRYSPFLCGAPHQTDLGNTAVLSEYRETCPY